MQPLDLEPASPHLAAEFVGMILDTRLSKIILTTVMAISKPAGLGVSVSRDPGALVDWHGLKT